RRNLLVAGGHILLKSGTPLLDRRTAWRLRARRHRRDEVRQQSGRFLISSGRSELLKRVAGNETLEEQRAFDVFMNANDRSSLERLEDFSGAPFIAASFE